MFSCFQATPSKSQSSLQSQKPQNKNNFLKTYKIAPEQAEKFNASYKLQQQKQNNNIGDSAWRAKRSKELTKIIIQTAISAHTKRSGGVQRYNSRRYNDKELIACTRHNSAVELQQLTNRRRSADLVTRRVKSCGSSGQPLCANQKLKFVVPKRHYALAQKQPRVHSNNKSNVSIPNPSSLIQEIKNPSNSHLNMHNVSPNANIWSTSNMSKEHQSQQLQRKSSVSLSRQPSRNEQTRLGCGYSRVNTTYKSAWADHSEEPNVIQVVGNVAEPVQPVVSSKIFSRIDDMSGRQARQHAAHYYTSNVKRGGGGGGYMKNAEISQIDVDAAKLLPSKSVPENRTATPPVISKVRSSQTYAEHSRSKDAASPTLGLSSKRYQRLERAVQNKLLERLNSRGGRVGNSSSQNSNKSSPRRSTKGSTKSTYLKEKEASIGRSTIVCQTTRTNKSSGHATTLSQSTTSPVAA